MIVLTQKQKAILCRFEGMPCKRWRDKQWRDATGAYNNPVARNLKYMLPAKASLTADQAALCLVMGVEVDAHIYGCWARYDNVTCILACEAGFRVPLEGS